MNIGWSNCVRGGSKRSEMYYSSMHLLSKRTMQIFFGIDDFSEDFRKFALILATHGYYIWQFMITWIVTVVESKKMLGKGYRAVCISRAWNKLKCSNSFCFWIFVHLFLPLQPLFRWLLAMLVCTLCSIVIWWIICGSLLPSLLFCLDGLRKQ